MTSLDRIVPSFHHRERHSRRTHAPPEALWEAPHTVRSAEGAGHLNHQLTGEV